LEGLPPGEYPATFTSAPGKAWGKALPAVAVGADGRASLVLAPRSVTTLAE
jgi:hypothetical protein